MSTAVASPSPPASSLPAPSSLRMTGSADKGSLAPAPPPTAPDPGFSTDTGTSRAAAISEFQHGMTSGR
ncbi:MULTISPECIES: hypothetical protein [unclassified Streptomyces]|uniref:hypothetical protein n=1 Tax=unclassified Streptomyces TaxID=2593676 RepID=UPI003D950096